MTNTRRTQKRIHEHVEALGSQDASTAKRAESTLFRYYRTRAVEPLIAACDHPNPQMRYRAVWLLGKSKDSRAYETVLKLTQDPDGDVRYDAALALGRLGDIRAIEPLIALIAKPDPETCVDDAAAQGIRDLGSPAVPYLIALLGHSTPSVCHMAAKALGIIGDVAAIEPLSELLRDDHPDTRIAGIEALAEIASPLCIDLIRTCLDDPAEQVRKNAASCLNELTAPNADRK